MKQVISLVLAVVLSFFIFVFMHTLIDSEAKALPKVNSPNVSFNVTIDDPPPSTIIRKKPPKIEPLVKQPELTKSPLPDAPPKLIKFVIATSHLPNIGQTLGTNIPYDKSLSFERSDNRDAELTPRIRIEPMFPQDAAIDGKQGFVTLSFDVDEQGDTNNIKVVATKPRGYFESSAKKALRKWKYLPKEENGKAVPVLNQTITLQFNLEGS